MNAPIHVGVALSDRLTPSQISQTIASGVSHARRVGFPDWMGAVDALIEEAIDLGCCFSSGELSAYLRTYRPDLVFSATRDVGNHLRHRYEAHNLPRYAGGAVVQRPRTTAGYSASPIGVTVYVYGPDAQSADTHLFEVQIPRPGGAVPSDDALPAAPTQSPTPVQDVISVPSRRSKTRGSKTRRSKFSRASTRRTSVRRTTAQIHTDRRMCVPKWAFTALSEKLRRNISGGDMVYVTHRDGEVLVSLDAASGGRAHMLVRARCRLLFTARGRAPFCAGDRYTIDVTNDGIRLDIRQPV
ncbi:MAG: hypothetical protein AAFV53_17670 [Myxococcota bacterium]